METTVDFDADSAVCAIRVSGSHKRPEDSHELLRLAGSLAKEHRCCRFIFDMRGATITGRTIDAYDTVANPEQHGFSRRYRIASVYPKIAENDKFLETVAANRGSTAFRVFDDFDAARRWITSD